MTVSRQLFERADPATVSAILAEEVAKNALQVLVIEPATVVRVRDGVVYVATQETAPPALDGQLDLNDVGVAA